MALTTEKRDLFERLYREFVTAYLLTDKGKAHTAWYERARADGRKGYQDVLAGVQSGQDITELALRRLLPHNDTTFNRGRHAWVTFAPAVTKEIKSWFENAPHIKTDPKSWPGIATGLVDFVRRCVDHPEQLAAACTEFAAQPHMRGFQTGMLTPILNALAPNQFMLVNNKSREVGSYFLNQKLSGNLDEYATTNGSLRGLVSSAQEVLARPESILSSADRFDMFCHWLVAVKKFPFRDNGYWKIAPGEAASHWNECRDGEYIAVGWEELGDLTGVDRPTFNKRRDECIEKYKWAKGGPNQVWRFAHSVRVGDRVVANKGWGEVVGIGTVTGEYYYEPNAELAHRLPVDWDDTTRRKISKHGWSMTLCEIDRADFEEVANAPEIVDNVAITESTPSATPAGPLHPPYSIETLAAETYQDLAEVERWVRAIKRKGQAVLFGPPGTGKTFCAERLAKHLVAGGNGFVQLVQFHPSYGYEDFIEGIRPKSANGGSLTYPLVPGRFREACELASRRPPSELCVLIIDEINRANLSRVFGELMYLLEYRTKEVPLASGSILNVPPNLLMLGTMNTADRSIALIDHALRRRFAFVRLPPRMEALRRYHGQHESDFDPKGLIGVLERLNAAIEDANYAVGVSFFMREDIAEAMPDVWETEIEPYLDEFFFDKPERVDAFRWAKVEKEILPE